MIPRLFHFFEDRKTIRVRKRKKFRGGQRQLYVLAWWLLLKSILFGCFYGQL